MNEGTGSEPQRPRTGRRAEGFHHRSERRSAQRAARRRKAAARFWLVVGPIVVLIMVVWALVVFLGGSAEQTGVSTEDALTTLPSESTEGSSLLVVEQGDASPVLVLLLREGTRGVALGMPGTTLVKAAGGFLTVSELRASDQDEALRSALADAFDVRFGPVASAQWPVLRTALAQTGRTESLPDELAPTEADSSLVASAVTALFAPGGPAEYAAVWEQAGLEGDASGFRSAVELLGRSIPYEAWEEAAFPGKPITGRDFAYYEPDVRRLGALLAGGTTNVVVTLEVQNGSGVVGAAEQAGDALKPLGYSLLPFVNADDFPDVKQTRIVTAPDVAAEAERVRRLLGVGKIVEDEALDPGRLIVVVGKDFVPPGSAVNEPSG